MSMSYRNVLGGCLTVDMYTEGSGFLFKESMVIKVIDRRLFIFSLQQFVLSLIDKENISYTTTPIYPSLLVFRDHFIRKNIANEHENIEMLN